MAITVDYTATPWLITIPKSDLTLDTGTKYTLTVDTFWSLLRSYAATEESLPFPIIYTRIPATSSTPSITEVNETYYALEFEDGLYSVNIINGNTNIREVEVKNQVSVNTNNTTGFVDPEFLQVSTFAGKEGLGIAVAPTSGTDNTVYPYGTREFPVKTEINFHALGTERGFRNAYIIEDITLTLDSSDGHIFFGDNPQVTTCTIGDVATYPGKSVASCKFVDLHVVGELDSANELRECIVGSITNANGFIYNCTLIGPIVINNDLSLQGCWVAPSATNQEIILDFDSLAKFILVSGWDGCRIIVKNMVTGSLFHLQGSGGKVTIDSTCIGGDARIYGGLENLNNGTLDTYDDDTTFGRIDELHKLQGLDISAPMTVTPTTRVAGSVSQAITGDGSTTTTVTRNP